MSAVDLEFTVGDEVQNLGGKKGIVVEVLITKDGNFYRVSHANKGICYQDCFLYKHDILHPAPPETPAPHGMEYALLPLDCCLGSDYYATQDKFIAAADALLRQKRPYHGYEWDASKCRYVLVQNANHPYPEL